MCIKCIIVIYVLFKFIKLILKGEKQMDAGGSCSHARNKIRYFGGLKISAEVASVLGVID
jgi:hypothetical protein